MSAPTALVTGATGGIGGAVATALARRGTRLVLSGRREDVLQRVVADCKAEGADAWSVPMDLSRRRAGADLVDASLEHAGQIDLFVHAAGMPCRRSVERLDSDEVERVTAVNYLSAVDATLALLPGMRDRGRGHIVFVGSVAGRVPAPRESAYSASKHALSAFADCLAIELEDSPVSIHLVSPGVVDTPMWDDPDQEPAAVDRPDAGPDDVAAAVLRLIDRNNYEAYVPGRYRAATVARAVLGSAFMRGAAWFDRRSRPPS